MVHSLKTRNFQTTLKSLSRTPLKTTAINIITYIDSKGNAWFRPRSQIKWWGHGGGDNGLFQGGLVPAGSAMAYLNSSGQVWSAGIGPLDQFSGGKGLFRPRTPLAAFSWPRRPLPCPGAKRGGYGRFGASAGEEKLQIDEFSAYLFQHCQSKLLSSKIVFLKKHK